MELLILFYIQISFEYIQNTGHRDPYHLSIRTSCLAPNNIEIITYNNLTKNKTLGTVLKIFISSE